MQNLVANTALQASQSIAPVSPSYAKNVPSGTTCPTRLHQSLYRVLTLLIAVLPGILAFFVALVIFALGRHGDFLDPAPLPHLGKFDLRMARKSGTDWTPATSPTEIIARVSFWACVLLGLSSACRPSTPPTQRARPFPFLCFPISRTRWAQHSCWLQAF